MAFNDILGSLRAVNNEFSVINSNLVGTNKTGYKKTNHDYGGGGAKQINDQTQIPDANLTTSNTSIDFGQGSLVNTGNQTDFGINGNGFFLLQQIQDVGVNDPNLVSRDGSFKFSNVPALGGNILTTNNGLVVLRDNGLGSYVPITRNDFDNNIRPSLVNPDISLESMSFSNKGSSVFEFDGSVSSSDGLLVQGSLEASNSSMTESMVAMSQNSKKFEAMASQLKVEQNNLDTIIGLFK